MKTGSCSIREVARHANVSPGTVSRVLNNRMGDLRVAEATRKKIIETARRLNYVPNVNARRLFSRRTGVLGLLVPSYRQMGTQAFADRHLTEVLSGLEKGLNENNYSMLLLFNDDRFIASKRYLTLFRERNIDGLLIWGAQEREDFWQELADAGYPHLFLATIPEEHDRLNYIVSDNDNAAYQATRHLIERGHRQIGWLSGKRNISITAHQEKGIHRALSEAGLSINSLHCSHAEYQIEEGRAAANAWLEDNRPYSALICANCNMGAGVIEALNAKGINVPKELALTTLHGCRPYPPSITRIMTNDFEIGEQAAKVIQKLIYNPEQKFQLYHSVDFIVGETT